ncbi:MAG: TetR/AcrR family transcriptional regulator [Acidipropionibacterium sp.]|nr:TetR/AcrR family transcriptional regulator [Acidipropionibacterium sp.]
MSSANSAAGSSGAHTAHTARTASSGRGPGRPRDPGRPRVLDPAAIGAGVLRIGIDRLTFARAARELGVSQATLYRYAPDRDALIRFGLDAGIDAFDIPPLTGDWEPLLRSWAFAAWDLLATMPGAAGAIGRGVVSPALIEQFGRVAAALATRGFAGRRRRPGRRSRLRSGRLPPPRGRGLGPGRAVEAI